MPLFDVIVRWATKAAELGTASLAGSDLLSLFFKTINQKFLLMTPKQLRAFVAVAQTLSFAQASERLHLSQPALSLALKTLEQSLGGALLLRSTRSVSLTPEGETLLPIARRLLADWENAEELMHQHFTLQLGKVSIAAMPSFASSLLPQVLKCFRQQHPKVNVAVFDVINEQVLDMVRSGRVELGVAFEPDALEQLQFTPFYNDRFVAVLPLDSPLAARADISWQQLLSQPFITLQRPSAVRLLLEQSIEAEHGRLPVAFESHQLVTVGRMVAQGLGVSAVPALCQPQMEALGARCLPLHSPSVQRRIGLLRLRDHNLSSAAQALAEVLLQGQDWPELLDDQ
jgi:LysR family carnitine catabolism transcriptional activator